MTTQDALFEVPEVLRGRSRPTERPVTPRRANTIDDAVAALDCRPRRRPIRDVHLPEPTREDDR